MWLDSYDQREGAGKYSVTNLGICGTTLSDHGASPWWRSPAYKALVAARWDVIFIMLGTNDARDVGSGGPEHWPRDACDGATAATLGRCSFATNYTALLNVVATLGRSAGSPPAVHLMVPPALMQQGAYVGRIIHQIPNPPSVPHPIDTGGSPVVLVALCVHRIVMPVATQPQCGMNQTFCVFVVAVVACLLGASRRNEPNELKLVRLLLWLLGAGTE